MIEVDNLLEVKSLKEIKEMIEENPLNVPVEIAEVLEDKNTYIFVDYLNDDSLDFDDSKLFFNNIQIQVYSTEYSNFIELTNFIKHKFNAIMTKNKDQDYWVGTFTIQARIEEWI